MEWKKKSREGRLIHVLPLAVRSSVERNSIGTTHRECCEPRFNLGLNRDVLQNN